ncbi:MAG: molecular chaperone TorD family protein [Proteobacteria bacterium]|nr:molecular chaperone TorD family protein [Pseudomonadota bacterium]
MNGAGEFDTLAADASARSALYATLARAFTYAGAGTSPLAISGSAYNAAFDPALGAPCSLRESAYADGDHAVLFEDPLRFYAFFGLSRNTRAELPDHLSVELEFMHYLAYLEANARGDADALSSLARAQCDFVQRHLRRLLRGVSQTLKSDEPRCLELVDMAVAFVEADLARMTATGAAHA